MRNALTESVKTSNGEEALRGKKTGTGKDLNRLYFR